MEPNFYPLAIVIGVVVILLAIFITRWLFRIDTMVNNLKAQTALLVKLCENAGVPGDAIDGIKNMNKIQ